MYCEKKINLRVAIYLRVSTLDQAREGYSLAAQEHDLRNWCNSNGYEIFDVYTDAGISGKDINHRPAMQQLINDASLGKFDIVAFWALSRFTRSVADLYNTLSNFDQWSIAMHSHTESFDTGTPFGRAVVGIIGVFAQLERELTSERVSAAMLERAMQGKRTTSHVLGYDLDLAENCFKINEREAEYVKFCFDRYRKFSNITKVAESADEAGYIGKRGRRPSPASVSIILTRPLYCGYNTYCEVLYPGDNPKLITASEFLETQALRLRRGLHIGRKQTRETTTVSQILMLEASAGRSHKFDPKLLNTDLIKEVKA